MSFNDLIARWEQTARRAFMDAKKEKDPMGKRVIENKAMCYFNCSNELKAVLASDSPDSSTIQEGGQK